MADKSECKYGANCYRKNKEHLNKFRHPDPVKSKRAMDELEAEAEPAPENERETAVDEEEEPHASKRLKPSGDSIEGGDTLDQGPNEAEESPEMEETDDKEEENSERADTPPGIDIKEELRLKFKVEMPQDFFDFWDYCKSINSSKPYDALLDDLGLQLGGPYDVMAGRLKQVKGQRPKYVLHHRYFYDPPEFQTVLIGDSQSKHHLGYYRDEPKKDPVFVASNKAREGCTITPQGENLFAAVKLHIDKLLKQTKDKTKLEALKKREKSLSDWAKKCNHSLEVRTKGMKARDKKVVTKTFHKAGLVVPVDSTGVGYRELPETDATLKKMLTKIVESEHEGERDRYSDNLQEIITYIQFANDECDYGQGYELGIDLFAFGDKHFHPTIHMLLSVAYQLLGREEFGEILETHLEEREKDDVSQIL